MSKVLKARLVKTNETVEVYQHGTRDTYVDYKDCRTEYEINELIFM